MDTGIAEPLRALTAPSRDRASRLRVGAGALVVLLLAALACATLLTALGPSGSTDVVEPTSVGAAGAGAAAGSTGGGSAAGDGSTAGGDAGGGSSDGAAGSTVVDPDSVDTAGYFVHVLGAVARPGLYELADSARVIDAIAAAGGLLDTADPARVNLARRLTDGEQLHVPAVGEAVPPGLAQPPPGAGVGPAAPGDTSLQSVNLNSATVDQLDALPRIGPALARRIVDWREANGQFTSVDDLLGVTGIGETILEGLRAVATV